MDAPLQELLSALDALLTELSERGRLVPDDPSKESIDSHMSQLVGVPGGAAALVARHGADERPAVVRPLAFLLAVAVNDQEQAHALAPAVCAMIDGLRTDDPWPRLNLCTAMQRLLMFDAIPADGATVRSALPRLLNESLDGPPLVRATAAAVVADLFYGRRTDLLPARELATLRTRVLALVDDPDELTRKEARDLREFLAETLPNSRV